MYAIWDIWGDRGEKWPNCTKLWNPPGPLILTYPVPLILAKSIIISLYETHLGTKETGRACQTFYKEQTRFVREFQTCGLNKSNGMWRYLPDNAGYR